MSRTGLIAARKLWSASNDDLFPLAREATDSGTCSSSECS